jgi:hypothetical protein
VNYLRETAAIDWITLTTWEIGQFFDLVAYIRRRHVGGWEAAKVMQYSGMKRGNLFYGTSEQRDGMGENKGHGMIRVSGRTRLDLELTKTPPKRYSLPAAYKRIAHPKSIVQSENCTLYIGNRASSPIFTRLYEKLGYLRLEFELKHDRARWAFEKLIAGVHPNLLYEAIKKKSRVPVLYTKHFTASAEGEPIDYQRAERESDAKKRLAWLSSIEQTITKMMYDDDIGEETRSIVSRIYEIGCDVDAISNLG